MNVIHVVPGISEESSGPSYSVPHLCEALIRGGDHVTLATLAWSRDISDAAYVKAFAMDSGWPRRLGASRALRAWLSMMAAAGDTAILHNHGMWQLNAMYPAWAIVNAAARCRLVVSPRGALSNWAMRHGSPVKRLFWPALQRPALRSAHCFHATSESEYADIRRLGFRQPVAIIPNGMDVPTCATAHIDHSTQKTLLFLGRIHPKKGLDLLLPAWAHLQHQYADWRLVIAGDDKENKVSSGYLARIRLLANELGACRVEFVGELRGFLKWQAYQGADLFVLPTYSENFGLTVAEALASGTPAVVTREAPWSGVESKQAGWWVDASLPALVDALGEAMSRSPMELAAMGERGRQWIAQRFCWDHVAEKMSKTYLWLAGALDQRPEWVVLD